MNTQGFDDNYFAYYEDVDWFWRLLLLGKRFNYAKNIFIYHEGAGSTGKGLKYKMFLWRNQNTLQTLIKNYSIISLLFILPVYFMQNLVEIFFFLLIFKPRIAFSYIEGWWFNIKTIRHILKKRKWIQKRRKVSDIEILKKMYLGPAKLRMLLSYKT
jgi:GT2 family glycosyltransferase